MNVAFNFGYESSDSFGTAFKNFHGFTPSEVRNGKLFKLVSRVQLALSVKGEKSMNITIQKKKFPTVSSGTAVQSAKSCDLMTNGTV